MAGGRWGLFCMLVLMAVALSTGRAAAAPARTPALPEDFFGVNAGTLYPLPGKLTPDAQDSAMAAAGVQTVRAMAVWSAIEPKAPGPAGPVYDWSNPDAIAAGLARQGLRWYVLLGLSTSWGSVNPPDSTAPPRAAPFATYAAAVAARYGDDGSFWREHPELPYVPARSFEVYNEPNLGSFWPPVPRPGQYADLYLATRGAVRAADPIARVVVGGLDDSVASDSDGMHFLTDMLAARPDLRTAVDAVGIHVYSTTPDAVMARITDARQTLTGLGLGAVPLDLNETGWTTRGSTPLEPTPVSDAVRGTDLATLAAQVAGSDCGVATMLPYAWITPEANALDQGDWFGLADRQSATAKPSGAAYGDAIRGLTSGAQPATATPLCHRPDLVAKPSARLHAPLAVTSQTRCTARTVRVRWTLGDAPEPAARLVLRLAGRSAQVNDPDGGGPRLAPTTRTLRAPRHPARLTLTASDALGRVLGRVSRRVAGCATPSRRR